MRPLPALIVRDAAVADLPRIVGIYNESIPGRLATADLEPVTVEQRHSWFERHSPDRRPLWIAASGQDIVGWLSFESFYGRPAYDATVEISIYVSNSAQRCGIGQHLLQQALLLAPRLRITTLLGFVFAHNAPSFALFEKFGFAAWGNYPGIAVLDGIERSLTVMGKRVG